MREQRQRDPGCRQQAGDHGDVGECLHGHGRGDPARQVGVEAILSHAGDLIAAGGERHEQSQHDRDADQSGLLAHDRKHEVGVNLRNIAELADALAEPEPGQPPGRERLACRQHLVAESRRIRLRIEERDDPLDAMDAREDHHRRERNTHQREGDEVPELHPTDKEDDAGDQYQQRRGGEVVLQVDQRREDAHHDDRRQQRIDGVGSGIVLA